MGKSTLLAQALFENSLAPTGTDVWLGLEPDDEDGGYARDLLDALRAHGVTSTRPGSAHAGARAVVDAVWQLAPDLVCLVLDDAHVLAPGSPGHVLLADVIRGLPANGHMVVSARHDPQLPLARLAVERQLVRIGDADLVFDSEELERLAESRSVEPTVLDGTGGWPAMAELAVSAGHAVAREFIWQEVIEPLGRDRRRVLAALVELGGGDDDLLTAALDSPVVLTRELEGVPLIAVGDHGWHRPHSLWQPMARMRLVGPDRSEVLARGIRHLVGRGRFDEAYRLIAGAKQWDEAPGLIRAACLELTRHPPASRLRRWLATFPADVADSPAGQLGAGVLASLDDPDHAASDLRRAVTGFHESGDMGAELGAIAHLGRVAYWTRDFDVLAETYPRIHELSSAGYPLAEGLEALGEAVVADLRGDDERMLASLARIAPGQLGPAWEPAVAWFRATAQLDLGDPVAARAIAEEAIAGVDDPLYRGVLEGAVSSARWNLGLDCDLAGFNASVAELDPDSGGGGVSHNIALTAVWTSYRLAHLGDPVGARAILDRDDTESHSDRPVLVVRHTLARASLLVADGNEGAAARVFAPVIAKYPLTGAARRAWNDGLCLTYVLLPEMRAAWDDLPLRGIWAQSRELAASVVAFRKGATSVLERLVLPDLNFVRAHLHHRFAAELAVGLHDAGRREGAELVEALGEPARAYLRSIVEEGGRSALVAPIKRALAGVPAAPPSHTVLGVLGPITLDRDGAPVDADGLRRGRVQMLVGFLVIKRRTTRAEVMATLWPDFDDRAATNNLRVTLNHLQTVLEPWRIPGEPGYLLRSQGSELRLVVGAGLNLDVDTFDVRLAEADDAERAGTPSVALDAYLEATKLWRGELLADIIDATWLDLERERYRMRYVNALQRAGQLQLARGDVDSADVLGRRAIEVDPWAEAAHGVVVGAALARGDRSAARRALDRAHDAVADLGVEPGSELQRLAGRLQIGDMTKK